MYKLFPQSTKKDKNYLDYLKENSMPAKVCSIY